MTKAQETVCVLEECENSDCDSITVHLGCFGVNRGKLILFTLKIINVFCILNNRPFLIDRQ